MVTIDDFRRFEFRVGVIREAVEHPDADRLLVLQVALGDSTRQLVAGIRQSYNKEDLIGRQVVVVANLQSAVVRGVESQGMVLAASDENGVTLIIPHREVAPGSVVK